MTSVNSMAAASDRLHGLDALRGFALLLGVALHASMSLLPGAQYFWLVSDSRSAATIGLMFYVPHLFRMLIFFLLAGFFGRMLHERLGTRAFLLNRLHRIGKPLLIFWAPILMAITAVLVWATWLANGGKLPAETPPGPSFLPNDFPLTHLWFLYELLLCYGVLLTLRAVIYRFANSGRLCQWADRSLAFCLRPAGTILLALPLLLALAGQANWYAWFGIPTPDQTLYPNAPVLASYWLGFLIGWMLHRQPTLLSQLVQRWHWHLGAAVLLTGLCLILLGLAPVLQPAPMSEVQTWLYVTAYAIAAWQWCWGLIGVALRFMSKPSPLRRYLADASYWIYIMHLPIVLALQVSMRNLPLSPWLKLLLIISLTMAVLLASYALLVRASFLGAMLNGRRRPRTRSEC
ncbi:acyltransferase family protein [Permianibacter sp. IMCC34836]|uniref:acyltransferase family protein n=1 Tax=Permianibacter fluminis TaxID=2738515 RepID=UPI0015532D90|nr:acyltransferase family protein [Permianibacter fluminis]NQD38648.1 acyltransferase family protein [Permianibacter fluminis]